MPRKKRKAPKKVAYLWGAGATQAEITFLGAASINLLMRDNEDLGTGLATRIRERLPKRQRTAFFSDRGIDIEKLISLLTTSNTRKHLELAETIRQLYFEDIRTSLATAQVLEKQPLANALLEMHSSEVFRSDTEELVGIMTTNHDGLLQRAAEQVNGHIDLGVRFESTDLTSSSGQTPPILQLHGSFTWRFGIPIQIELLTATSTYSKDTVWIPPAISKESKSYPFNRLTAMAYELLSRECDVLRVVGSALAQNDWHILALIFCAQRHMELTSGSTFQIELITLPGSCVDIERDCSYLKGTRSIGYLTDGDFAAYNEPSSTHTTDMKNPLAYWLKTKIEFHRSRNEFGAAPFGPAMAKLVGDVP